ncbi:hypothetical protein CMEL01_12092 [Colletotrichum melonis]|uniref:Uncharacterized protein n=1 Tax=Colletotrichum melonis TaxID=1209925 RepID=A0AAI9UX83_9PEZI|nr:hypothetical protein CMEL01_12092 [Colletotrichum melonis]
MHIATLRCIQSSDRTSEASRRERRGNSFASHQNRWQSIFTSAQTSFSPSHAKNSTNHPLPTLISQHKALDPVKPRSLISAFSGAVADSEPVTALVQSLPTGLYSRALEKLQKESNNCAPAPAPRKKKAFETFHHQGYGTDTYTAPRCKVTSAAISLPLDHIAVQRSSA